MSENLTVEGEMGALLVNKFQQYHYYSAKGIQGDLEKQSKELAERLFIEAPRASLSAITGAVQALGWKVKRPPQAYLNHLANKAFKAGPETRAARAARKKIYDSFGIRRKGKESGVRAQMAFFAANPEAARQYYQASKSTLEELQNATIRFRANHIGYIASTFIPAMRQLGSTMSAAGGARAIRIRPVSSASIAISEGRYEVTITNGADGVVKVASQDGFVDRAIVWCVGNMQEYIDRKKEELAKLWEAA